MKTYDKKNLADWYQKVLTDAQLFSYAPVKGCINFKPFALALWKQIQNFLNEKFAAVHVQNVYLPFLIPVNLLAKEEKHLKGFNPEIYLVNEVNHKKLKVPLAIRPTSEVLFAEFFKTEVSSYRDLPMCFNQWCSVLRHEQNTKPFLRNSEFLWQEGHTLHASKIDAINYTKTIIKIYYTLLTKYLALAPLSGYKSTLERFSGAFSTYTHEVIMPDGQSLQLATIHDLIDNFTSTFNIKIQNQQNQHFFPFGTSWGISTRALGGLFLSHGDEWGLNIPPKIAPVQVLLISKTVEGKELLLKTYKLLKNHFRVSYDFQHSFKHQANLAQCQGVPLQLHFEKDIITAFLRKYNKKVHVLDLDLKKYINDYLNKVQTELYLSCQVELRRKIKVPADLCELKQIISNQQVAYVPCCNDVVVERKMMDQYGISIRCFDDNSEPNPKAKCFFEPTKRAIKFAYVARSY